MIPCKECLKFAICKGRDHIDCRDVIKHLMEYYKVDTERFVRLLTEFEEYYDKEVAVITEVSICLDFKKEKDHHSCMIAL